jgi:pimeloyl-ACP methyl ester carboxylesterase
VPYANNQGVRIHYEVEGQGPPIVLHHGFAGNLEDWRTFGYVLGLEKQYQLILVDARGHGQSDKPHDPAAYRQDLAATDVVGVLDHLGIGQAHFWGYSMGAGIGFEIARYGMMERFSSLILGGTGAYPASSEAARQFFAELNRCLEEGVEPLVALLDAYEPLPLAYKAGWLANDVEALKARFRGPIPPDSPTLAVGDLLRSIAVPGLLYAGDVDPIYESARGSAEQMPRATFVSLPGLDHPQGFFRSDLVLPHVKRFLAEVSKG